MGGFLQRLLHGKEAPVETRGLVSVTTGGMGAYQGARISRRESGWITGAQDANGSIILDLPTLRSRSRELTRNNPWANKFVQTMANNVCGPSLSPSANSGDRELDKIADMVWWKYQNKLSADGLPFPSTAIFYQAVAAWVESGEVLVKRNLDYSQSFPLSISLLEADFLDHSLNQQTPNGGSIIAGIEQNQVGRIVGYHLHKSHPGAFLFGQSYELQRIDSTEIAHLFRPTRPGQRRGVPWLSPSMLKLRDLDRYCDYELVRKKLEASLGVFITGTEPPRSLGTNDNFITGYARDLDGNAVETVSPGGINYLGIDQDIKLISPSPQGGYSEYIVQELHNVSAGLAIPYALLSGDLRQVNYSSIRAGMLDYYRSIQILQRHFLIPLLAQRIWDWVMESAYLMGEIETPSIPCEWTTSKMQSIDPKKDAEAALLDLRIGARTLKEIIQERGRDYDDVIAEMAYINEQTKELGLHFEWQDALNQTEIQSSEQDDLQEAKELQDDQTKNKP